MLFLCSSKSKKFILLFAFCLTLSSVFNFIIYLANIVNNRDLKTFKPAKHYLVQPKNVLCNPPPTTLIVIKSAIDEFDERHVIRNTWIPMALNLNMKIVFSIGYSNNTTIKEKLSDEVNLHGDISQANFMETYHHLVLKTYWNRRWITSYCAEIESVFFIDSDVIVFPNTLLKVAKSLEHQNNMVVGYCWMTGAAPVRDNSSKSYMSTEAWPKDTYPPYCSGTGYFMTGDVPEKLLNIIPNGSDNWLWAQNLDHLEDVVFTGLLTSLANVKLQHTNRSVYNKDTIKFDLCQGETISVHSFRSAEYFWETYANYTNYLKNHCSSTTTR